MGSDGYLPLFETKRAKGRVLYRLFVISMFVAICLIWIHRVCYIPIKGEDGRWGWIGLLVAELWFGLYWVLTQAQRWNQVYRSTFKDRLSKRYEKELPKVDIFVCTADPVIEPPVMVINTVLSVMAYDYPPENLSVYLSDDGGSNITYYALLEASHFAKHWLPYCKKFKVEPSSPAAYLISKDDPHVANQAKELLIIKMTIGLLKSAVFVLLVLLSSLQNVFSIRFVIDREECFSHNVQYEGDTVHLSFVVIKVDGAWHYTQDGVDLVVKGPSGEQVQDFRDKTSEKFEFVAQNKGLHRFCFTNKSPYHETVDFDIHVSHFSYYDQHAKDEHFNPLLEQISKLEEALYNIQFEQHWLEAQTERQAIVNDAMSKRAVHKAFFESAALVGASILQVYLLRRLFERKLGMSRV
ncbi:Cellulose synthase [Fagus crenata]